MGEMVNWSEVDESCAKKYIVKMTKYNKRGLHNAKKKSCYRSLTNEDLNFYKLINYNINCS